MTRKDIEALMKSELVKEFGSLSITDSIKVGLCSEVMHEILNKELDERDAKIETAMNLYHSYRKDYINLREDYEEIKQQLQIDESELAKYRKHYAIHGMNRG